MAADGEAPVPEARLAAVNNGCTICGKKLGPEALDVGYLRSVFWFCSLGCLATWVERKMCEAPCDAPVHR